MQRGHNRASVFAEARDFHYYLANLQEWKAALGCRLYAYCLMTNHIHLIVDPGTHPEHLALLMKHVAARQTRFVNALEGRTGSLWEGRYKSSAIETERYLLACCRYVELNPVRSRMADAPEDYLWSRYRHKAGLAESPVVDLDPCYLALGGDPGERVARYRRWVAEAIPPGECQLIRDAVQRGQLTASQRLVAQVRQRIGRRIAQRGRGRPKHSENESVPF